MFLCIEGLDGAGKSTQAKMIYEALEYDGIKTILTREPGGTKVANLIREIIINEKMDELTEYLLFSASRRDHIVNLINPALKRGETVICDRFIDSSWAYQPNIKFNTRKNVDGDVVETKDSYIIPDMVFVLDISPEVAMERLKSRGNMNEFDKRTIEFFRNTRAEYLDRTLYQEHYYVIDASNSEDVIHKKILDIVRNIGY